MEEEERMSRGLEDQEEEEEEEEEEDADGSELCRRPIWDSR